MKKKWEKREHPLCTFDELLDEYEIEITDDLDDPDDAGKLKLIDDSGEIVTIDLNVTLEDLLNG